MDIQSLRKEYTTRRENYNRLKSEVIYILRQELKEQKIPIHQITGRIKPFSSFSDKVHRQKTDNPFERITDICGVRVICLFLSDIERLGKIVESKFVIQIKNDKIYSKPEEAFGYLSVHYVGTLLDTCRGPRYDGLENLKFEIQLRTIAMHSWSTISHYLDYKSPHSIPSHLRKDFYALSALFYIADSHFELFFHSREAARETAVEKAKHWPDIEKEEINLDTLSAYLRRRYPIRVARDGVNVADLSHLIEELRSVDYSKIHQLKVALNMSDKAFQEYEKTVFAEGAFTASGVVRWSLRIIDSQFPPPLEYPIDKKEQGLIKKLRQKYRIKIS